MSQWHNMSLSHTHSDSMLLEYM